MTAPAPAKYHMQLRAASAPKPCIRHTVAAMHSGVGSRPKRSTLGKAYVERFGLLPTPDAFGCSKTSLLKDFLLDFLPNFSCNVPRCTQTSVQYSLRSEVFWLKMFRDSYKNL